jgi:Tol biopolymer transport system component
VKKTMLHTIVLGLIVQFASMASVYSGQQDYKLLDEDTFLEMETVGSPNISPDGKQILFTRSWIDKISDRTQSNFWISDITGTRVRELTHGNWKDSSPEWSPDGKKIAFLSDRDGTTQIHVMWYDTQEVAQLSHIEREPSNLRWSPDGEMLTFTYFVPDTDPILDVKLPTFPKGAELGKSAVIVDRLSWARDGQGPTDKGNTHIYILDAELGGTPVQVTSG